MQTECAIEQAVLALSRRGETQLSAAINAVGRLLEVEGNSGAVRHHPAEGVLEMATVKAAEQVMAVPQSAAFQIRTHQQSRHFNSAGGEDEHRRMDLAMPASSVDKLYGLDAILAAALDEPHATR